MANENREFTVRKYRDFTVKEGWGVNIDPIWDEKAVLNPETGEVDASEEFVSDLVITVTEIRESLVIDLQGTPVIKIGNDQYVSVEDFKDFADIEYDDTHDLRDRWFPTKEAAQAHADYTLNRFRNPQPWESFVMMG